MLPLVCFVLLRFRLHAFIEAVALRPIVLRHAGAPIATRLFIYLFFVYLDMSLFPSIFLYHCRFSCVWRVRRSFVPFRMVCFYLVTTGWIFYISLCENPINSINSIKNQSIRVFQEEKTTVVYIRQLQKSKL